MAQAPAYCGAGEPPQYQFGFAVLKTQLGSSMGEPVECEHVNPANGDTLQTTTLGLAYYRKQVNTPVFTDGYYHWGLTTKGLVAWDGAIDLPLDALAPAHPVVSAGLDVLLSLAVAMYPPVAGLVPDFGQRCPHWWPRKSPTPGH
ncbi:MAG: hypothetical protein M3069_02825 [Chloroflexota bacterium]|nr:hypothetical protein [Chloroflexota bacterium]